MTEAELSAAIAGTEAERLLASFGIAPAFVAQNVLSASGPITVAQIAMLWMGMPNKHDRKRVRQLLDALVDAGLLSAAGEDTYTPRAM
jgi:hypothetical protein